MTTREITFRLDTGLKLPPDQHWSLIRGSRSLILTARTARLFVLRRKVDR